VTKNWNREATRWYGCLMCLIVSLLNRHVIGILADILCWYICYGYMSARKRCGNLCCFEATYFLQCLVVVVMEDVLCNLCCV